MQLLASAQLPTMSVCCLHLHNAHIDHSKAKPSVLALHLACYLKTGGSLSTNIAQKCRREAVCRASLGQEVSEFEDEEAGEEIQLDSSMFEEVFPSVERVKKPVGTRIRGLPSPHSTLIPDDWKDMQQYICRSKKERKQETLARQVEWALEERLTREELDNEQRHLREQELVHLLTPEEYVKLKSKNLNFAKIFSSKWSPIHTLAASGQDYCAAKLLNRGVDLDAVDGDELTPLHRAVQAGRKTTVEMLLKAGANAQVLDSKGATLLHYSAQIGDHSISKLLLRHGVDVSVADADGWTPLHVAVQSGRLLLVKILVHHGADIYIANKDGNTALDLALAFADTFNFYGAIKFLEKMSVLNSVGTSASIEDQVDFCSQSKTERVSKKDCKDAQAQAPATIEKKHLLTPEERAKLKSQNLKFARISSSKWSPLHTLAASGQVYLAEELLKKAVDVYAVDGDGLKPLHRAVQAGQKTMVRMLLNAGANAQVLDNKGATLLHYSAQIGDHSISKLLLRHGVDVNVADAYGWTPLHVAVLSKRLQLVKALVYRGADIDIANKDGNTALGLALACDGPFNVINFLKKMSSLRIGSRSTSVEDDDEAC